MGARALGLITAGLLLVAGCGTSAPAATPPSAKLAFERTAQALVFRWNVDVAEGVPASSLAPLRHDLAVSPFSTTPASDPLWSSNDGSVLIRSLTARTATAWTAAIADARQRAAAAMASWTTMAAEFGAAVPAPAIAAQSTWAIQLAAARTPVAIDDVAAAWVDEVGTARVAATAARLAALLQPFGGLPGLVAGAGGNVATARADHLDPSTVPALLAALQAEVAANHDPTAAINALLGPLGTLRALLGADSNDGAALAALAHDISRATAAGTPHAAGFGAQYASLVAAFHGATTAGALAAVGGQVAALHRTVLADFPAPPPPPPPAPTPLGCGAAVPGGKVVVVSLSSQSAVFYENRCSVNSSLVTTGKPGMRTPMGTFHVFSHSSPAHFVSGYAPGSPRYYTPQTTQYAVGYAGGGFFLHDAPWEPADGFGPGSENGPSASHGCIHLPTPTMGWFYGWGANGTTVIITG